MVSLEQKVIQKADQQPAEVGSLREELDDYREALNENTNEIQSNYEYVCQLDEKLNKLNEKLELILSIIAKKEEQETPKKFTIAPLTKKEKEVFAALYTICEEEGNKVTYKRLSERSVFSETLFSYYITSFLAKGIKLTKKYEEGIVILSLDPAFREAQAKENIVGVNTLLSYWIRNG